jgi:two-component system NtrC family sensor kinase
MFGVTSLKGKMIVFIGLILILSIGFSTFLTIKFQRKYLLESKVSKLNILTNTIEKSLSHDMQMGRSYEVQKIVEMVGENTAIKEVRIFSKNGTILISNQKDEIGRSIKPLFVNSVKDSDNTVFHEEFSDGDKRTKVLSIIKPIFNRPECFRCHSMETKIVGILDVGLSVDELDSKITFVQKRMIIFALLTIFLASAAIIFLLTKFIDQPIRNLIDKMGEVEKGNIKTRMILDRSDEIGVLCKHFNRMTKRLDKYQKDIERHHQEQMERADRLASLGEISSVIAHEIRNPLAGIKGAVEVFKNECSENDPKKGIFDEILRQIDRIYKTVKGFLHYSKSHPSQRTSTDLNKLLDESLLLVAPVMEKHHIKLMKDYKPVLPRVDIDRNQLKQVFLNIFINTIQAMPHGGITAIKTGAEVQEGEERVFVEIKDTGKGIPDDVIGNVFKPFFSTKKKGTGLGLAISQEIIHDHSGTISLDSKLGQGTTVKISLPGIEKENICREKAS